MQNYDRDSLESTLIYLKGEYGLGVLTGRSEKAGSADITVIIRDFYNTRDHKGETSLLGVVHRNETLKRLVYLKESGASGDDCLSGIRREIKNTVDCFVREDVAEDFVNMLARVIGLNVPEVRIGTVSPAPVVTPTSQSRPKATPTPSPQSRPDVSPKRPAMIDEDFVELCATGSASEVEEALKNGANVNAKDNKYGWTALHKAAVRGHANVAEVLLRHGANVNAKDNNGWTALHCAAGNEYADVAEILLRHGADVNAKGKHGRTALSLATEYYGIQRLLRAHGAKS